MRALRWTLTVLALGLTAASLSAQENRNGGSPAATPDDLELPGIALGEFTDVNARIARSSAQRYIESVRRSGRTVPEKATALMAAAQKALDSNDNYRAFRLSARGAALGFLAKELLPHIASRFRTKAPLVLWGYSIGEYKEGRWTKPQVASLFAEVPDFVSPSKANYAERDKIFVMEKTANGWGAGKLLVEVKQSGPRMTVARSGNIRVPVFSASRGLDVAVMRWKNGAYQPPETLPDFVNSDRNEEHLYVAPEESYLLFDSERAGGLGKSDLYISFHRPDGSWSQARNLGAPINTAGFDFNIRVSPDSRYLFYSSGADGQLHWVDFQAVLRSVEALTLDYLGQTPPGDRPEVFAKGPIDVRPFAGHAFLSQTLAGKAK